MLLKKKECDTTLAFFLKSVTRAFDRWIWRIIIKSRFIMLIVELHYQIPTKQVKEAEIN